MKKILCALFMVCVFSGAYAAAAGPEPTPKCFDWLGNGKSFLKIYFDNDVGDKFPEMIGDENKDCEEALREELTEYFKNGKIEYYILGAASKTGEEDHNKDLSRERMKTVEDFFKDNNSSNEKIQSLYLGQLNAGDPTPNYRDNAEDRSVVVCFGFINLSKAVESFGVPHCYEEKWKQIKDVLALRVQIENKYPMIAVERSVWKDKDGEFNTARLLSDSIAGVVLGTAGGLITANVVKKNQIENGFEDLRCTVGGQTVADWGDEFSVGRK